MIVSNRIERWAGAVIRLLWPTLLLFFSFSLMGDGYCESTGGRAMEIPGYGKVKLVNADPGSLSEPCLSEHLIHIEKALHENRLLRAKVRLTPGHPLIEGVRSAPHLEYVDSSGVLLLMPLSDRRLFSRHSETDWRLWEIPSAMALSNCVRR